MSTTTTGCLLFFVVRKVEPIDWFSLLFEPLWARKDEIVVTEVKTLLLVVGGNREGAVGWQNMSLPSGVPCVT